MGYSEKDNAAAEIERVYRVLDTMISAHSMLRDRYNRRSTALSVSLILASIGLCGFTFSDASTFLSIGLDPEVSRLVMGGLSILLLGLSICEWKLDWKAVAERHGEASALLIQLKPKLRELRENDDDGLEKKAQKIGREFAKVTQRIMPIPDREFVPLKSRHLQKIELSKYMSRHPKCPRWALYLAMWLSGLRGLFAGKEQVSSASHQVSSKDDSEDTSAQPSNDADDQTTTSPTSGASPTGDVVPEHKETTH